MHLYKKQIVHNSFVCFTCRIRVRAPQNRLFDDKPIVCPQCRGYCDNVGSRCPIPAKNKLKAWQDLHLDYRRLQRRIADAYCKWKNELKQKIEQHKGRAEHLGLTEIATQDEMWLAACYRLPEMPEAYRIPFHRDWLAHSHAQATWSGIGTPHPQAAALEAMPYNADRQREIEKLLSEHNSLHIYDLLGELWYRNWLYYPAYPHRSELGKQLFFRLHLHNNYSPIFSRS